jgi:hypothetical protein
VLGAFDLLLFLVVWKAPGTAGPMPPNSDDPGTAFGAVAPGRSSAKAAQAEAVLEQLSTRCLAGKTQG